MSTSTQVLVPAEPESRPGAGRGRWLGRVARTIAGGALLVVGAALLVLPGPGLVVIAAGLAVLAVDYPWARRLLRSVRTRIAAARDKVAGKRAAKRAASK